MTDHTDDGWPEKYRDPRDPYPDILRVTVESFDEVREDTLNAVAEDDSPPAIVSFATVGELRKVLTARCVELLQTFMHIDGVAETALADDLDRDYRPVHNDVTRLSGYGLVFIVEDGRSKRPYVPYEHIHLDVDLLGATPGVRSCS